MHGGLTGVPAVARAGAVLGVAALLTLLGVLTLLAVAGPARAGQWMQVSCVNPDGSAAPHDGWTGSSGGTPALNSDNNVSCGPGQPMTATMLASGPTTGGFENLTYTPPTGSTLDGGTVQDTLSADGHSQASPNNSSGAAGVLAPDPGMHPADELTTCAYWSAGCWHGSGGAFQSQPDWSGTTTIPSAVGGTLTVSAACLTLPSGGQCDTGANGGYWARATMSQADLMLFSSAVPQGADFSGSALQRGASGVAHVVFTASDPGPGVYSVGAAVDRKLVYAAMPNTNGGRCVPVGRDPSTGALMFDWQQPCPSTEVVDVPIPTAKLADGAHHLEISVVDAASNLSIVYDSQITTHNPSVTPNPRGRRAIHARFVLSWRWQKRHTHLLGLSARRLPKRGRVRVACAGRGCPRLRVRSVPARHWGRLRRELAGRVFTSGDRLYITVTAPHRRAERILIRIRNSRRPSARLR